MYTLTCPTYNTSQLYKCRHKNYSLLYSYFLTLDNRHCMYACVCKQQDTTQSPPLFKQIKMKSQSKYPPKKSTKRAIAWEVPPPTPECR